MENGGRVESDLLGEVTFPKNCLYGIATERAVQCSSMGASKIPGVFFKNLGKLKLACAIANQRLGLLSIEKATAIAEAAEMLCDEKIPLSAFPVEIFQTGGCTPINMNVNEVIRQLASKNHPELKLHANDDCNLGQSTNDIIPSTLNMTLCELALDQLIPALKKTFNILQEKERAWADITILGRTHTMDAVFMTLGQVFSGYKRQVEKNIENISNGLHHFLELPIGGTAVGNGWNTHSDFGKTVIKILNERWGNHYVVSKNRFEQQSSRDDYVYFAGLLDTLATTFIKIANDIRWYGSGPVGGLNELIIPVTQAGSSCMPGKVNPVVCETLLQVCIYVQGHCDMVRRCAVIGGQFQLNTTSALLIYALIEGVQIFAKALNLFCEKLLCDLQPNLNNIQNHVQNSYALLNDLAPQIGYDKVASIIQEVQKSGCPLEDVLKKHGLVTREETFDKSLEHVCDR